MPGTRNSIWPLLLQQMLLLFHLGLLGSVGIRKAEQGSRLRDATLKNARDAEFNLAATSPANASSLSPWPTWERRHSEGGAGFPLAGCDPEECPGRGIQSGRYFSSKCFFSFTLAYLGA